MKKILFCSLSYIVMSYSVIVISFSVFYVFSADTVFKLCKEDGIIEYIGAMCFLASSVIFYILFQNGKNGNDFSFFKTKKNWFFLLMAIAFFIAFGEEMSWGQRLINLNTPKFLVQINYQREINIHNNVFFENALFNVERIFFFACLFYYVIIPLLTRFSSTTAKFFKKINLPIVPVWLGLFFLMVYFTSKIIQFTSANALQSSIVETKESLYGFLCLSTATNFLTNSTKHLP